MDLVKDSLDLLELACDDIKLSEEQYKLAVYYAVQGGYNNVQIAKTAGTTEASIRRFRKKHAF